MDGMMEFLDHGVLMNQALIGYISFVHNSSGRSIETLSTWVLHGGETAVDCIFRGQIIKSGKWPG